MASTEKIMERVRALLAIAEHPNTPPEEADTALTQANKLILRHAIDEALLRAAQTEGERRAPLHKQFPMAEGRTEFMPMLRTILNEMALANRCQAVFLGGMVVEIFGMDEDVRWVEMLYTSVYFQFLSKLNPKWDESLPFEQNVYNFKVAGYAWIKIDEAAVAHGHPTAVTRGYKDIWGKWHNLVISSRMLNSYKKWAKKIGDTNAVSTNTHTKFRRAFAEGFQYRLADRLQKMSDENVQEADTIPGAALALVDTAEAVNKLFWEIYPQYSPEAAKERQRGAMERAAKARQQREDELNAMTEKQRYDFLEKEERERRRQARRNQKYWEQQDNNASSYAGTERGRKAADSVDLSRKAGATERGENSSVRALS